MKVRSAVAAATASVAAAAVCALGGAASAQADPAAIPNPVTLTITQAKVAFAAGQYSSVELTQAYLSRIDRYEPFYNAFTAMNPDALREAAAAEPEDRPRR